MAKAKTVLLAVLMLSVGFVIWLLFLSTTKSTITHISQESVIANIPDAAKIGLPTEGASNILESAQSQYAYITLLHGIDESFRYRGYLYNVILMKNTLKNLGSTADFILLVGFSKDDKENKNRFKSDLELIASFGIKLYFLPRWLSDGNDVNFGEMALLKVSTFMFVQYKKVQFLDGDIMITENMDCYFELDMNTYNAGSASPLNSGWFLAIPSMDDFQKMKDLAIKRLNSPWDISKGWNNQLPLGLSFARGKPVMDWSFNGASLDQGLMTHYFLLTNGRGAIVGDVDSSIYAKSDSSDSVGVRKLFVKDFLACCNGRKSTSKFVHFTGQAKPWLSKADKDKPPSRGVVKWMKLLDELNLSINSSNVRELNMRPPLGFFYPNK